MLLVNKCSIFSCLKLKRRPNLGFAPLFWQTLYKPEVWPAHDTRFLLGPGKSGKTVRQDLPVPQHQPQSECNSSSCERAVLRDKHTKTHDKHCPLSSGGEREAGALHAANGPDEESSEWKAQPEVGVDDRYSHHHWGKIVQATSKDAYFSYCNFFPWNLQALEGKKKEIEFFFLLHFI